MLLFIFNLFPDISICYRFNTSHVTLYPGRSDLFRKIQIVSIHLMLLFILALFAHSSVKSSVSIHLMLLFIIFGISITRKMECFNTSHVTLYLNGFTTTLFTQCVSIHLMLLFILYQRSCYCWCI